MKVTAKQEKENKNLCGFKMADSVNSFGRQRSLVFK